jgi:DNA-binding MarR family transcriptional regulator
MPNAYRPAAQFRSELRRFLRRAEHVSRTVGITPNQYGLLLQIGGAEDGSTTVTQLVEQLQLTQSAVTELVQRAEAAGLVDRRVSETDGRVFELSLTELGEKRLEAVHTALGPERAQLRRMVDALEDR